jgi:hypothetical protein
MKKIILFALSLVLVISTTQAQDSDTTYWKNGGVFNANYTNTGFSDFWQGGGIKSLSVTGLLNLFAKYEQDKTTWENTLDLAFGNARQGDQPFLKSEDRIDLNSKFGYKLAEKVSLSSLLNFRTQFAPGFEFANNDFENGKLISRAFAPAYLNLGVGLDYKPNEGLSIYYAPINGKVTMVGVDSLRTRYMPADFADQSTRFELGSFLKIQYRTKIMENVTFQTKADFFTNYLQNFGNIDVNWENLINMQVNKYLVVSFFTHTIYDDDIKFDITDANGNVTGKGPRTQFKRTLGVGFTYAFGDK